ncbi:hypothetical protein [Arthrobacter roseus]|uniref:hypothetical protein n=1 Tax=Arthrobacter roseus TaxID=136274 RepID=UPI001966B871|nr:hypothetical protein [Arthrobacter roseus]MBM7849700.1 hypothetical protein [Arthrobacter roseus]
MTEQNSKAESSQNPDIGGGLEDMDEGGYGGPGPRNEDAEAKEPESDDSEDSSEKQDGNAG